MSPTTFLDSSTRSTTAAVSTREVPRRKASGAEGGLERASESPKRRFRPVVTERVPFVGEAERMKLEPLDKGFTEMSLHFGFAEAPAVPPALEAHRAEFPIDIAETSFFLGLSNRFESCPYFRVES
jgi:hypothetical protein